MTQVSADDSRHEVRLTVSDDVQAILHTDQHEANPELNGLPPTAVKTLSRLQSDWTVRRSTLDSPWFDITCNHDENLTYSTTYPPHDAVLSRLFNIDTPTLIDALINEGRNGPLLAALRNTDDL